MSNVQKIIFIVIIIIITIFLFIFMIRPALLSSLELAHKIEQEKGTKDSLGSRIDELVGVKNKYHTLNAEYQRLSMELPSSINISILNNEIYDIARYADVYMYSVDFKEVEIPEEEKKEGIDLSIIEIKLIAGGSYHQILNFLSTLEKIPRIIIIEDIVIQSTGEEEGYSNLMAYITARSYFGGTEVIKK